MALSVITVPSLSAGVLTSIDVSHLENEIGLINFNRLVDNSAAIDDFVKGFSDAFVDETGVNTSANSNSIYNNTTDTYASALNLQAVDIGADATLWQGNTSNWTFGFNNSDGNAIGLESSEGSFGGNARSTIRMKNVTTRSLITGDFIRLRPNNTSNIGGLIALVHEDYASHIPGDTTGNHWGGGIFSNSSSHWFNGNPTTAGVKASALYFGGSNMYAYNVASASTSSAVSYTGGSSGTEVILGLDSSTNRMYAKVNGTLNTTLNNTWADSTHGSVIDGDFYIIAATNGEGYNVDLDFLRTELILNSSKSASTILASTFQTAARTAVSTPSTVRLVMLGKEEATQTLNSDTVFQVSRNNGSNFSSITMSEISTYNSSGVKIYTGTVDVSGQPSGTQIVLKVTCAEDKRFTIHGYSLLYKQEINMAIKDFIPGKDNPFNGQPVKGE